MNELLTWGFDTTIIAGSFLWTLALYIALENFRESVIDGLERWFNFAERSLYMSKKEFESFANNPKPFDKI